MRPRSQAALRAGAIVVPAALALVAGRGVRATAAEPAPPDGTRPQPSAPAPSASAPATATTSAPSASATAASAAPAAPAASTVWLRLRSARDGARIAFSDLAGEAPPPPAPAPERGLVPLPPPWPLVSRDEARLSAFFRSVHEGAVPVDARLVALLARIAAAAGGRELLLVSGYREPSATTGRGSFHTSGMAADIAIDGKRPFDVYLLARAAGASGAGLYGAFVHVDVRERPFFWSGGGPTAPITPGGGVVGEP